MGKPVPMITTRKVYRTIIIALDGREESVQERVEERGQPGQPEPERQAPEEKEEPEEETVVTPMEVPVEEALPVEPEEQPEEKETFVDEYGRVVRKTITVRKRIVRRIIRMPDGTKKEVEEEVPVSDSPEERTDTFEVIQREEETPSRPKEPQYVVEKATEAPEEVSAKEPRHVERVYV